MRNSVIYELDAELITKKELARRLKVCERTVEIMCNEGTIPKIVFGRSVRFKWSEALAALESVTAASARSVSNRKEQS
jgi:excisionase family DNA binding protein